MSTTDGFAGLVVGSGEAVGDGLCDGGAVGEGTTVALSEGDGEAVDGGAVVVSEGDGATVTGGGE